ncbi:MAG: CFI-box-CTERM domain-containing protein, partial [Nitrosopumilaceae archaeon]
PEPQIDPEPQIEQGPIVEPTLEQISYSSGGGCLIATATYGSELAPQVQELREIRDNKLGQTVAGSAFMKKFNEFYYSFSPTIADYQRQNPIFKEAIKISITPMISSLTILNHVNVDSEVEVLGIGISLILLNVGVYFGFPLAIVFLVLKKDKKFRSIQI